MFNIFEMMMILFLTAGTGVLFLLMSTQQKMLEDQRQRVHNRRIGMMTR